MVTGARRCSKLPARCSQGLEEDIVIGNRLSRLRKGCKVLKMLPNKREENIPVVSHANGLRPNEEPKETEEDSRGIACKTAPFMAAGYMPFQRRKGERWHRSRKRMIAGVGPLPSHDGDSAISPGRPGLHGLGTCGTCGMRAILCGFW